MCSAFKYLPGKKIIITFLSKERHIIHLSPIYLQMFFLYTDQHTIKDNQTDYKSMSKIPYN